MPSIKLQSEEKKVFDVEVDVARMSQTIKDMMDDLDIGQDPEAETDEQPVPLPNVSSVVLEKVLDWSNHHKGDAAFEEPDETKYRRTDDVSEWDKTFYDVDQGLLFDIIIAADYLNIPALLDTGCKTVTNMIIGKTPEEIRKHFHIKNDLPEKKGEKEKPKPDGATAAAK